MNNYIYSIIGVIIIIFTIGLIAILQTPILSKHGQIILQIEPEIIHANVKEINITAKKFEFVPNTIIVNSGDLVRLEINSEVEGDFILNELGINETIILGTQTIEFIANKKGIFTFGSFCEKENYNLEGTLIVE